MGAETATGTYRQILSFTKSGPEPLYYRLAQRVIEAIGSGMLLPGDQLPPEKDLAADLNISRATLRNAWAYLEKTGVLSRRQGAGTFVA